MRKLLILTLLASMAPSPVAASAVADPVSNAQHNASRTRHVGQSAVPRPATHVQTSRGRSDVRAHQPSGRPTFNIERPPVRERAAPAARVPNRIPTMSPAPAERPRMARPELQRRIQPSPRPAPNVLPSRPVVSHVPRPGTEPPLNAKRRHAPVPHWNRNWRNDRRYDWRNWRRHHHSRFHLRTYIDPFGWGYYRYAVGWRLWPGYYGHSFWIVDPGYYGLPPAPPGTHWVRYYNDALLVDSWTGEVLDAIHDFFW